jgi:hypothetical protein
MSHAKNKSGSPLFRMGNKVRVKYGVIDPDFPDIPLGADHYPHFFRYILYRLTWADFRIWENLYGIL